MTIINSTNDLDIWIWDVRSDVGAEGTTVALRKAIQDADHPAFGTDWSEWLDENVEALVEQVLEAEVNQILGDEPVIPESAVREVWR